GDDGAIALARSPLATRVASLELATNGITEAGIRALAEAEWPALRYLSISGNPFGAAAQELKTALRHVRLSARKGSASAPTAPPPMPVPTFEVGAKVEIRSGPYERSTGVVESVSPQRRKLRVRLTVLGSPTSIEFNFSEVE